MAEPPPIAMQAAAFGAKLVAVDGSLLSADPCHYNSSLIRDDRGLWLIWRNQDKHGHSTINRAMLDESLRPIPTTVGLIDLPLTAVDTMGTNQREDPRAFHHNGSTWLSYTAWRRGATDAAIALSRLDDRWRSAEDVRITYGGNWSPGVMQKNWSFFPHEKTLHFIYYANPHEVVDLANNQTHKTAGVLWEHGIIRGGTPPILVGDRYVTFFHSSRDGDSEHGRRYYMGAYSFSASPPFTPLALTKAPILKASDLDPSVPHLPLVVFPCGAVHEDGRWIVSLGVNDVSTALLLITDDVLAQHMEPI
jgi:predicted GH43/DUF377 family glycosyl hydrolase